MRTFNPAASLAPLLGVLAGGAVLAAASSPGHAQIAALKLDVGTKAAAAVAAAGPGSAAAQARSSAPPLRAPHKVVADAVQPQDQPSGLRIGMVASAGDAKILNLSVGKSAFVELPVEAKDVLVTDPTVADAVLRSRRRISILGLKAGDTDAVFFDAQGKCILSLNIRVGKDSGGLADALGRLLPGSKVRVESLNDTLVLAGEVSSAADAQTAQKLAASFVARPDQVVNLLTITGKDQVMLKVRIVEMQRNIIKQLGFNLNAVTGQLGMPQYQFGNSPSFGVNGSFMGGASGGYSLNSTAQAVSNSPFGGLGAAAQGMGVSPTNAYSVISQFLTGTGVLSGAQQAFSQTFLSNLLGTVQTNITPTQVDSATGNLITAPPFTATAANQGITTGNIAAFEQAYLNGTPLPGGQVMTDAQKLWLNAFNTQLQTSMNSQSGPPMVDRNNPLATVQRGLAGSPGLNQASAMLQAFERVGLVRTLAEPNLTAISGESAKFLAGGEFPVPNSEDNNGRVSVTFKPYGVGLGFSPVVLSEGRISLKISAEVSELTSDGGFTIGGGGGAPVLSVPGLKVRRTETTVELPSGGAMMISGLMQQQSKQNLDALPGLTNLPVLGALFRSRDYLAGETELVVIVTPYLVNATSPDQLQTPTDGLKMADDLQTDLFGKLNVPTGVAPATAAGKTLQGPYGYVIE